MSDDLELDMSPKKPKPVATTGVGVVALLTFLLLLVIIGFQLEELAYYRGQGILNAKNDSDMEGARVGPGDYNLDHATRSAFPAPPAE